jgi:hypothetical protein
MGLVRGSQGHARPVIEVPGGGRPRVAATQHEGLVEAAGS